MSSVTPSPTAPKDSGVTDPASRLERRRGVEAPSGVTLLADASRPASESGAVTVDNVPDASVRPEPRVIGSGAPTPMD